MIVRIFCVLLTVCVCYDDDTGGFVQLVDVAPKPGAAHSKGCAVSPSFASHTAHTPPESHSCPAKLRECAGRLAMHTHTHTHTNTPLIALTSWLVVSPIGHVSELMLPEFLDFVIWGHEHECLVQPQLSVVAHFLQLFL
jgi:hypothetical protein